MPRPDAFQPHDEHLDQGDILANVPFVRWTDWSVATGGGSRGVITSNGCSCEDYERAIAQGREQASAKLMLQVAPLTPVEQFPPHRREEILSGRYLDRFYVYGDGSGLGDQVLDFAREQPVPARILAACPKIARIAEWQWQHLLIHLAVSRFHQTPEELFRAELLVTEGEPDAT